MMSWTKDLTIEFIHRYKDCKCLWQRKSNDYMNRHLKNKAYQSLVQLVKPYDRNFTREDVIKKINNLRSSFRKECKKIESNAARKEEDAYKPRLFYYEELLFLVDDNDLDNKDDSKSIQSVPHYSIDFNDATLEDSPTNSDEESEHSECCENGSLSQEAPPPVKHEPTPEVVRTRKRKRTDSEQEDPIIAACNALKNSNSNSKADRYDIFGQHVANSIRTMSTQQQIFAQKLISDVLYEGCLGSLSRGCRFDIGLDPSSMTAVHSGHATATNATATTTVIPATYVVHQQEPISQQISEPRGDFIS